jgi:hypothetical protein
VPVPTIWTIFCWAMITSPVSVYRILSECREPFKQIIGTRGCHEIHFLIGLNWRSLMW